MSVRSLNIAATGMVAMQQLVDVIAHNIANTETAGFKKGRASFNDLIYQTETRMGTVAGADGGGIPTGTQFGLGVALSAIYKSHQQGPLIPTPGAPLNLAISGPGFLVVTLPTGETAYTRGGSLQKNANGEIVTPEGYVVSPGITVPNNATSITISADGRVQVSVPNDPNPLDVGRFDLATFINPPGLDSIGTNFYLESSASGAPTLGNPLEEGFGELKQYFIEESNVNSIEEITSLIKAQRNYELNSKVVQTTEQMLKTAVDSKV
jgi:flagellar basal-body rod protein FlgG